MNILLSILKFPPDFTGAGMRLEKLYTRLLNNGSVDSVFVLTSQERMAGNHRERRDKLDIFFVGGNNYVGSQTSVLSRFKKMLYVVICAVVVAKKYLSCCRRFQIVHTVDSSWLSTLVGWLAYFTGKPLVKEIVLIGTDDPVAIRKQKSFISRWAFLFPFFYAKLVITISEPLKALCLEAGIKEEKIWSRPNPVYIEGSDIPARQAGLPAGVPAEGKNVLFVGVVTRRKNLEFLLRAGTYLHGRVNLLFAGPVEDGVYFEELLCLAREVEAKTAGRVKPVFLGWIRDRTALAALYGASDLFWFASNFEGMGNVIIESLMCGTPVVTLPVNGIMKSLIEDGRQGYVVEGASVRRFARAAEHYLYDARPDRAALSKESRSRFDPQLIERNYLERFRRILCPAQ